MKIPFFVISLNTTKCRERFALLFICQPLLFLSTRQRRQCRTDLILSDLTSPLFLVLSSDTFVKWKSKTWKRSCFLKKRKQYVNTNLLGLFYENASDPMNACGVSKSKITACCMRPLLVAIEHFCTMFCPIVEFLWHNRSKRTNNFFQTCP